MVLTKKIQYAKKVIKDAVNKYGNDLVLGCSFGKDSMVLLHIALQVNPNIRIFSVVANTEFQGTYDFIEYYDKHYLQENQLVVFHFKQLPEVHRDNIEKCCGKPKVEATKKALKEMKAKAWLAGIRNTEGVTRAHFKEKDDSQGIMKINPILEFTEQDVWRYLAINEVPMNPLYKYGYRSLGCAWCSVPEEHENEPERAGRWKGTCKQGGECGIHTCSMR